MINPPAALRRGIILWSKENRRKGKLLEIVMTLFPKTVIPGHRDLSGIRKTCLCYGVRAGQDTDRPPPGRNGLPQNQDTPSPGRNLIPRIRDRPYPGRNIASQIQGRLFLGRNIVPQIQDRPSPGRNNASQIQGTFSRGRNIFPQIQGTLFRQ